MHRKSSGRLKRIISCRMQVQTYRKPESGISKETVLNISKSDDQKMIRTIEYRISRADLPEQGPGPTVNEYLRKRAYSRHLMTYLRHHEDTLTVNGRSVFTNCHLAEGDVVRITFTDEVRSVGIIPVPLPLDICYEDEDILVVNKPPFLPIQPSLGHPERTLGNAVAAYYEGQGIPFVYRCVNRLDRNTSGLTIIAKNMASSAILYDQMKNREIHRTYLAVVHGRLEAAVYREEESGSGVCMSCAEGETGTIDLPIARRQVSLIERCVDFEKGQRSVTHYRRVTGEMASGVFAGCQIPEAWDGYDPEKDLTAVAVQLETGRTHQIRLHMSYIGHPLVGDTLYGESMRDYMIRQALHSWKLDFIHPVSRSRMHLEAPLPEDMRQLFMQSKNRLQL